MIFFLLWNKNENIFLSTATENKSSCILITIDTHYIWTITLFTISFVTWKKRESHWFGTTCVMIHQVLSISALSQAFCWPPATHKFINQPCINVEFIIFLSSIHRLDSQIRIFYSSTVFTSEKWNVMQIVFHRSDLQWINTIKIIRYHCLLLILKLTKLLMI